MGRYLGDPIPLRVPQMGQWRDGAFYTSYWYYVRHIRCVRIVNISPGVFNLIYGKAIGLLHDSIRFPAPGELIHANNATHHLHCRGPSNSKHIAVAFAGVPWSSIAFRDSLVNPPITICAHDRLGYGWSSHPTDQSRDA